MTTFPATYCPDCGTRLEERRIEGRDRRYCSDCERVVWHTPVPAAGVAVVGTEGVLCVRRDIEPNRGAWMVPGGHMEADERPAETAVRELREEATVDVDPDALVLVGTHSPSIPGGKHMVVVDYAVEARAVDGTPTPGDETADTAWLRADDLADGEQFYPNHERIVRRARELLGDG